MVYLPAGEKVKQQKGPALLTISLKWINNTVILKQ